MGRFQTSHSQEFFIGVPISGSVLEILRRRILLVMLHTIAKAYHATGRYSMSGQRNFLSESAGESIVAVALSKYKYRLSLILCIPYFGEDSEPDVELHVEVLDDNKGKGSGTSPGPCLFSALPGNRLLSEWRLFALQQKRLPALSQQTFCS